MRYLLIISLISLTISTSSFANMYFYRCVATQTPSLSRGDYNLIVTSDHATLTQVSTKKWLFGWYDSNYFSFIIPYKIGGNLIAKKHYGYMGSKTYGKSSLKWLVAYKISAGRYENNWLDCKRANP